MDQSVAVIDLHCGSQLINGKGKAEAAGSSRVSVPSEEQQLNHPPPPKKKYKT